MNKIPSDPIDKLRDFLKNLPAVKNLKGNTDIKQLMEACWDMLKGSTDQNTIKKTGRRQLSKMAPKLDTNKLAKDVANLILGDVDDTNLDWSDNRNHVLIKTKPDYSRN